MFQTVQSGAGSLGRAVSQAYQDAGLWTDRAPAGRIGGDSGGCMETGRRRKAQAKDAGRWAWKTNVKASDQPRPIRLHQGGLVSAPHNVAI